MLPERVRAHILLSQEKREREAEAEMTTDREILSGREHADRENWQRDDL